MWGIAKTIRWTVGSSLLAKINEIEPENAAERTAKYAHGVRDLEESTDGRVVILRSHTAPRDYFSMEPGAGHEIVFLVRGSRRHELLERNGGAGG